MKTIKSLALGAGAGFITLAVFVQGFLPALTPESRDRKVTRAVRNDLGDVKWVWHEAADYTELEKRGRGVYIREGCWYCHSQYVRPVTGEDLRWGPVSEAGEYHFDAPHLFSTRRIGPDLTRVGLKFADGWHYAHHWDARMVVPDSNMPSFKWLFHQVRVPVRKDGEELALGDQPELARYFTMAPEPKVLLFPNEAGLAFADPQGRDGKIPGTPVLELRQFGDKPPAFPAITVVVPSADMVGLVAYIQKLGTNRGAWRDVFEPQNIAVSVMQVPQTLKLVERGREVYMQRCVGCHGETGDGNGPAATFLQPRPRDFTTPAFKFRTTPSGSLPTDGDLFRTITRGVRWTAMPTWHELHEKDRLAVLPFIKTFAPEFWKEPGEPPIVLPEPPPATPELIARGKELFRIAKCWECHGDEGKGDGPSAAQLKTDDKLPIRPTDFTRGQFKGGSSVRDIFRTMTTGLNGTPMPSFVDSMKEDERWAISYFVLSLSAFTDPLTGQKLRLDAQTKAELNRPEVAHDARYAYDPERGAELIAGSVEFYRYRYGMRGGPRE
ncbi:MAG: cbb3-type cytochrome c oxidase subunit II [Actinomycetota bacterium]